MSQIGKTLSVQVFGMRSCQGSEGYLRLTGVFPYITETGRKGEVILRGVVHGREVYSRCTYAQQDADLFLGRVEQVCYCNNVLVEEKPYPVEHYLETLLLDHIAALIHQEKEMLFSEELVFSKERLCKDNNNFLGFPISWRDQWKTMARTNPDTVMRYSRSYILVEKEWNTACIACENVKRKVQRARTAGKII